MFDIIFIFGLFILFLLVAFFVYKLHQHNKEIEQKNEKMMTVIQRAKQCLVRHDEEIGELYGAVYNIINNGVVGGGGGDNASIHPIIEEPKDVPVFVNESVAPLDDSQFTEIVPEEEKHVDVMEEEDDEWENPKPFVMHILQGNDNVFMQPPPAFLQMLMAAQMRASSSSRVEELPDTSFIEDIPDSAPESSVLHTDDIDLNGDATLDDFNFDDLKEETMATENAPVEVIGNLNGDVAETVAHSSAPDGFPVADETAATVLQDNPSLMSAITVESMVLPANKYSAMTITELRTLANEMGLSRISQMRKNQLIDAIIKHTPPQTTNASEI